MHGFGCTDLADFTSMVVEELKYRGISHSRFYLCDVENVNFLTKLSFYKKSPPELYARTTLMNHIDTEIEILSLLRETVIDAGVSPCIVEILYENRCTGATNYIKKFKERLRAESECSETECKDNVLTPASVGVYELFEKYIHMVNSGIAVDKWAFIVLEQCDITLEEYLKHRIGTPVAVEIFKTIMFQIIYTIYALTKMYPTFKHNDLHTENVMLKIDHGYRWSKRAFMKFTVNGNDYYIPYFGITVKIIDFGFSTISELGIVSNVIDDLAIMFYRHDNDMLTLFHWINRTVLKFPTYDNDVDKLLRKLDPSGSYLDRTANVPAPSVKEMISSDVFDYYTRIPPGILNLIGVYKV
jgi:serine/threonine protein kinase